MIVTLLAVSLNDILIAIPLYIIFAWALASPFIGLFHLCAWTYRWYNREGMPELYTENLKKYIKWVGIYLLVAVAIIALYNVPSIYEYTIKTNAAFFIWLAYFIFLPVAFPIYYWKNIFGLSRKLKKERTDAITNLNIN